MSRTSPVSRLALIATPCPASTGRPASRGRPSRAGGLQLTRAADYAVRALIHLAVQPAGARLSQADIANAIDAPAPFVGKVMQQLASAGLVTSQRGIGGGFALHPAAGDASMLDAVQAIEGPLALNVCLSPDERCGRAAFCPAHLVWHEAQRRVADVLRAATLRELATRAIATGTGAHASARAGTPAPHGETTADADGARERSARGTRAHLRGDDAVPPPPRERARSGRVRFRGTGECPR